MATAINNIPYPNDTEDIEAVTPQGIGQFLNTTYITADIDNKPHNQLKANQNILNDNITSLYQNKVETDDVVEAKTANKIPIRNSLGAIFADLNGNATSATTLSAGSDRNTVDALKAPAFANFGTTGGTVAEGNHHHDSRYFQIDTLTKLIFASYPLPAGWSLDSSANDKTIIIGNSGAGVGVTGGSWTISGFNSAGGHDHELGDSTSNIKYPQSTQANFYISRSEHKHSVSYEGNHNHTHNGAWRPAYVKTCIGVRS